jgi:hypothetical protein
MVYCFSLFFVVGFKVVESRVIVAGHSLMPVSHFCLSVLGAKCWMSLIAVVQMLVAAIVCRFSVVGFWVSMSVFEENFYCWCPTLHSMHLENAQLVNFSGKGPANSCHLFFSQLYLLRIQINKKSWEMNLYFLHFCVTTPRECTRIQRTFGFSSSLLLSEELPHGAGQRIEHGTYFAVGRRLQLTV